MRTLLVTLTTCLLALPACAKYSGGSGTAQDPYQIATAADLIALGETPEDYDKHFILTADIDLDPNLPGRKVFEKAVIAPASPINAYPYVQGTPFTGILDGNGHSISHLTIRGQSWLGLFGRLKPGGEVTDLGVVDVNIIGSAGAVGGLIGFNQGGVTACFSTGAIDGKDSVGGLVGGNRAGTVIRCYSTGVVSGTSGVGGLVGTNEGDVTQCYSAGSVSGDSYVGGLVGYNGFVMSDTQAVWGLARVIDCYSSGSVSGDDYVGGLVGTNGYYSDDDNLYAAGSMTRCYSTGPVSGAGSCVGGLTGNNAPSYGQGAYSFWDIQTSGQATSAGGTGKTTAQMQTPRTFIGWWYRSIWTIDEGKDYPHLYWEDMPGGPIAAPYKGSGTPADPYLIDSADQLDTIGLAVTDWDKHFKLTADLDLSPFAGKDGRPAFNMIAPNTGVVKSEFSGTAFTGVFDGNDHTISHLTIQGESYVGLFGRLETGAEVKNLGLADVSIAGSGTCVGSLAAENHGTLTRCYSTGVVSGGGLVGGLVGDNGGAVAQCNGTGVVSGTDYVGGLAGRNTGTIAECGSRGVVRSGGYNGYVGGLVGHNVDGVVTGCYSTGPVSGIQFTGGLAGYNYRGTVTGCYSTGPVSGSSFVGGVVGLNDWGLVTQCYSTGAVTGMGQSVGGLVGRNWGDVTGCFGIVSNSFWDTQTSGQTKSDGGTGKTTAQMQTAKTFLEAGWDFVGETANGTADLWWILEGKDYPRLWWEGGQK